MALLHIVGHHQLENASERVQISYFSELNTRASNTNTDEDIDKWSHSNNGNAELMLESHIICFSQGYLDHSGIIIISI